MTTPEKDRPAAPEAKGEPGSPAVKKPVAQPRGKMLGEIRDYFTVQMEQDDSWNRYPSRY